MRAARFFGILDGLVVSFLGGPCADAAELFVLVVERHGFTDVRLLRNIPIISHIKSWVKFFSKTTQKTQSHLTFQNKNIILKTTL